MIKPDSLAAACESAGIEGLHMHDLRREAGSRLVEAGGTVFEARDLLGHAAIGMTNTYLGTTVAGLRTAVERMERWREAR